VDGGSILEPRWTSLDFEVFMPVNLSIKNVPDVLAERLRERAARAHRSLQGELKAILEEAAYLWLARELGVELVTLDARLEAAGAE
jgi:plasmid stability protein